MRMIATFVSTLCAILVAAAIIWIVALFQHSYREKAVLEFKIHELEAAKR